MDKIVSKKSFGFDDLAVGMTGEYCRILTEQDIEGFAQVSGDVNPIHLDEEYAKASIFGDRISHGILTAGYISATFGAEFPGPGWIYVNQSLRFKAPVKIGDQVDTQVTVSKLVPEKKFVEFKTVCKVGESVVLDGEATLMAPKLAG